MQWQSYSTFSITAPSPLLFQYKDNKKKNIWMSHHTKTQKLTNPHAQLFRFLWQSVTKYIKTCSKPVNIFKTFEKYNIYLIKYPLLPTECCVWGTSYLNDKAVHPNAVTSPHNIEIWGGLVPDFLWLIVD